jgi:molybdenum ABC transporter molybdate-binding protein
MRDMRRKLLPAALAIGMLMMLPGSRSAALAQEPLRLYAAGSLRGAMTAIAAAFAKDAAMTVDATFGASGLLRKRIEQGEPAEIFASADVGHPLDLMRAGKAGPVVVFTRNRLCALARPGLNVTSGTLLDYLLDPQVRLGTSTPEADPAGDYTWALFRKANTLEPGSYAKLDAKAIKVMGGSNSPAPPQNQNLFAYLFETHQVDMVLVYCTSALAAAKEIPAARVVDIPHPLSVGADYGLTVIAGARPDADRFALYILSSAGQKILARFGFTPVTLPSVDQP